MYQKVNDSLETVNDTNKVEDDILKIKMQELQEKVQVLVSKMNMLLIKYSTTDIVAQNMKSNVSSIVKSEASEKSKTHGQDISNVTLACEHEQLISAHKAILASTNSFFKEKPQKKVSCIDKLENPDLPDVTLLCEEEYKFSAHRVILSSSSNLPAQLYMKNSTMIQIEKNIQQETDVWNNLYKNIENEFVRLTVLGEKHSTKRMKLSPPKEPDKESGQPVAQSRPSPTSSLQCKTAWSNQDRETKSRWFNLNHHTKTCECECYCVC